MDHRRRCEAVAGHGPQGAPGAFLIPDLTVRDGRLGRNVAEKVNLPRPVAAEQRHLTISQVERLARECGYPSQFSKHRPHGERAVEGYRLAVLFLAYTGVRFGEMAALRAGRDDLDRRRAVIADSVTVVQGRGLVWGTPKTHHRREVPIPRSLADELAPHLEGMAPTTSSSPGGDAAARCGPRSSVADTSTPPPWPSGSPGCTPTSYATRRRAWPSPREPT